MARMWGKTPSSRPHRKTTGNSNPLAACRVIRVTELALSSSVSMSETRETFSRKAERDLSPLIALLALKLLGDAEQFADVLHAGLGIVGLFLAEFFQVARRVQDVLHQIGHALRLALAVQVLDDLDEGPDAVLGAGGNVNLGDAAAGVPEGDLVAGGEVADLLHGAGADGAGGDVDDAPDARGRRRGSG